MSLSKIKGFLNSVFKTCEMSETQTSEDNYRRDSFSDRVCDDLSEVILQFLPIEDKFRFECVDKQFQRTVFQRHYEFFIPKDKFGITKRSKYQKTFQTIFKKLSNIKSLKSVDNLNNQEIEVVFKNCNHLTELNIDLSHNSTEFSKSFANRFGPQLTSISLIEIKSKFMINLLVNIQNFSFYLILNSNIELNALIYFYTQIKPKSLKKVSINLYILPLMLKPFSDIQREYFKTFIDNNRSITHLTIKCLRFSKRDLDLNLGSISQLNHLLSLQIESKISVNSFKSDLKQIADNCHKLKSLSLTFDYITEDLVKNDIMSEIKKFKELKRLEFNSYAYLGDSDQIKNYFVNSLKIGFEGLTHLTLGFDYIIFNDKCFDRIDINLPKLQKLIIKNPIEVTELTADILSRLSRLETLELIIRTDRNKDKDFVVLFEKKILKECRKIKSLKLQTLDLKNSINNKNKTSNIQQIF